MANIKFNARHGLSVGSVPVDVIDSTGTIAASSIPNLDASKITTGIIDANRLPSYVDDVIEYTIEAPRPVTGEAGKIYVAQDTSRAYRWSGTQYVEIVASPGSTDAVSEGTTNKYFTDARARGAISVAANTNLSYDSTTGVLTGPAAYILPTASADDKGGVKVGSNLAIAGDVLTYKADAVETLTNKRVQPRVQSQTVATTAVDWNSDNYDQVNLILTQPNTTVNLDSGTPTDGQKVVFRIKDNGTVISFTLTSSGNKCFKPIGLTLPTSTTTANKLTYIGCIYNSTGTGTWDVVAVSQEA